MGVYDMMLNFSGGTGFLFNINYIDFNLLDCISGDSCDDNNPLTENDVFDAACNCVGEPILFTSPLLEAEQAIVGSLWTNTADSNACNCVFVLPPDSIEYTNAPPNEEDRIRFEVNLDVAGVYKIYARISTTNDADDSFWVRANNGTWQKWNKINFPYDRPGYQWSQVGNWVSGDNADPVTFNLNAGLNTVDFAWREPGARLDKIFITQDDLSALNTFRKKESSSEYSFKYIVEQACPGDSIYFEAALNGDTILINQDSIPITKSLFIIGSGPTNTILSGMDSHRIFTNHANQLLIKDVSIIDTNPDTDGGAFINNAYLILNNVIFENNRENGLPKSFTNNGEIHIENGSDVIIRE